MFWVIYSLKNDVVIGKAIVPEKIYAKHFVNKADAINWHAETSGIIVHDIAESLPED
jgi:hypothetical protein